MPKWTKADGTPQKTIYHSYLAREGRLMVKIKGDPFESKFKKGQMVVYFQVPDDDTEYALNIEPECVQDVIDAPKGTWLTCTAFGQTKDEPKALKFTAGDYEPSEPSEYDDSDPMDGPPPMWPDDAPTQQQSPAKPSESRNPVVARAASWTIEAVKLLEAAGIRVDSDAAARMYNTHFIQATR